MSKYALKLEQLVQTDHYGDMLVTIQYDGFGPKLITVHGDLLDDELKHSLDTFLGFVNFVLSKGNIHIQEIATHLETEPQDGVHLPINDLLMVISASLQDLPETVGQIESADLMEVLPEMVKEFTENVATPIAMEQQPSNNVEPHDQNEALYNQAFAQANTEDLISPQQDTVVNQQDTMQNQQEAKKGFFGNFSN